MVALLFMFTVINFADKAVIGIAAVPMMHELARRYSLSRNLIRLWVRKYQSGEFTDELGKLCTGRNAATV